MKLCMVAPYPKDRNKLAGGVQAVSFYLLKELADIEDLDIDVISCDLDVSAPYSETQGKMAVHRIPAMRKFGNIFLGYFDRRAVRKKILEILPDIVHFQTSPLCLRSRHLNGIPTVVTVHGMKVKEMRLLKGMKNALRFYPILLNELRSWKSIEHLICISPYVQSVVQSCAKNIKCYFIANPVRDEFFQLQSQRLEDKKNILCVGFVSRLKNTQGLIQAVSIVKNKISNVELVIAGDIQDQQYFEATREIIRQKGLESTVIFMGHLNEDEILKEYARCSLVVLFSDQENSPMVLQQAMAAGKSVVATRVGGVSSLVRENETGYLVERGDTASFAAKIIDLLADDERRRQFGENARREALNRFRAKEVAAKTYEVYRRIIGGQ